MQIGDPVIYLGKRYVLLGLDPIGVPERLAQVQDPVSDEVLSVPVDMLVDAPDDEV